MDAKYSTKFLAIRIFDEIIATKGNLTKKEKYIIMLTSAYMAVKYNENY